MTKEETMFLMALFYLHYRCRRQAAAMFVLAAILVADHKTKEPQ